MEGTLPYNLDAEKAVISALMLDSDAVLYTADKLGAEDFYYGPNRTLFSAVMDLHKAGTKVDFLTLTDELERKGKIDEVGGYDYITGISTFLPSLKGLPDYVGVVRRTADQRALARIGLKMHVDGRNGESEPDEIVGQVLKEIEQLTKRTSAGTEYTLTDLVTKTIERLDFATSEPDKFKTAIVKTGWQQLDKNCPIERGDLVIMAARPGMGKSALGESLALSLATQGWSGLFESIEMSATQIGNRMTSKLSGIPVHPIRINCLDPRHFKQLWDGVSYIDQKHLTIIDTPNATPSSIKKDCRRAKARGPLDFVFVDYLQIIKPGKEYENKQSRVTEVGNITAAMKALARELEIVVFLLCQLNREVEKRANHKPVLADLRESGAIEQDADVVWMIHRDSYYDDKQGESVSKNGDDKAELLIRKNRNGPIGTIRMTWDADTASYRER
jgi:replicative DNA helicase